MPDRSLTLSKRGDSGCLPKLAWFHRLPEILDILRGKDVDHLHCQAVKRLFPVRVRRGGGGPQAACLLQSPYRLPVAIDLG